MSYEKYKPVELGWLSQVPTHWEVKKLKHVALLKSGNFITAEDITPEGVYPVFGGNGLRGYTDTFTHEGAFVLVGRQGALCGNINYAQGSFYASEHALVALPKVEIETTWLGELLRSMNLGQYSQAAAQPGLSAERLQNLSIPVPPLPEQRAIAAYLDRKTAQLDTLLAQKQALLQKLHQQRQALINEAVTQGLNPTAPRKPSGVAWLGDVPVHWAVKKLKYVLAEPMMYGANEAAELDDRSLPRYIRITDFGQNGKLRDETFKSLPHELAKGYLLRNGDVLFARSGATVGKTFFFDNYEGQACFAGYLIKATFDTQKVLPEFVYLYTKSGLYENWKNSIFIQSTIQNISAEKYKALLLAVPPVDEQKEIIAWLEQRNRKLDEATATIHTQIQTLKAYRQSLISEVVTGKVDVRASIPNPLSADAGPTSTRGEAGPARNQSATGAAGFQTSLFN